jgi:hypothetical protein
MATIFSDIQLILDAIAKKNGKIGSAPHGVFWRQTGNYDSDYTSFTTGEVPNFGLPIIDPANPKDSNFFVILINPNGVQGFPQMPAKGPFITGADYQVTLTNGQTLTGHQIQETITNWLNNKYPK